jgi:hypothetical protein
VLSSAIVPLVAAAAFAGAHWITLRNKRRVQVNRSGRIVGGLDGAFDGVHVQDLAPLAYNVRELQRAERQCKALVRKSTPETFPNAGDGARELLEANPELAQLLEEDCSHDCTDYRAWKRGGRRGPKPKASPGDGRFDPLNERLELKGKRKVGSWAEAVDVTVPPESLRRPRRRRWEDFGGRVPALEEATGIRIDLPAPAEAIAQRADHVAACETRTDQELGELLRDARSGRVKVRKRRAELEGEAPF